MIHPKKATTKWQHDTALERFQMISPFLDEELDKSKRIELRAKISKDFGVSERTLYRYEAAYRDRLQGTQIRSQRITHRSNCRDRI